MPAHSDAFPWPSYYGHFDFFEQRMRSHTRVRHLEALGNGRYQLTKTDSTILNIFICECYSFGAAEYLETTAKLGRLDVIVVSSNWCDYTDEIKVQCRGEKVGLFKIRGFMASLNLNNFWAYLDEQEEKRLKDRGVL